MITQFLSIILLILLNAFFAGSEMAFISVNVNKLKLNEDKRSLKIIELVSDSTNLLSSIQVGVTLSGFMASAVASEAFSSYLVNLLLDLGLKFNMEILKAVVMFMITLMLSYLTILFGELVPKKIAMSHPEKFASMAIYPISFFSKVFNPIVMFLTFSTKLVLKLFNINADDLDDIATEEEIKLMVSVSSEGGHIDENEREMIDNIFAFDDLEVEDIMTHRTEIIAIDEKWSFEEIMNFVAGERYTRYPVYKDSLDNIIGTIHLRDLLAYLNKTNEFVLTDILRKAYYVPTSKMSDELFSEFKVNKTHLAVVIDEYGGTAGIITMEDLIEEILGEIADEYDDDETDGILRISDDMWIVDGDSELVDLYDELEVEFPLDKFDTVSGFVVGELGRLPQSEDVNSLLSAIEFEGYRFIITKIDDKVVAKVKITRLKPMIEEEVE
ncbi:MAG: HlyC/CorC family transporter [Erysipelothrix sp.]|nr:HlyC/CorC family transporter [Erysipelothrix sp.]